MTMYIAWLHQVAELLLWHLLKASCHALWQMKINAPVATAKTDVASHHRDALWVNIEDCLTIATSPSKAFLTLKTNQREFSSPKKAIRTPSTGPKPYVNL